MKIYRSEVNANYNYTFTRTGAEGDRNRNKIYAIREEELCTTSTPNLQYRYCARNSFIPQLVPM
jgi:hypothetical protein